MPQSGHFSVRVMGIMGMVGLALFSAPAARGDDAPLRKQILDLNNITGSNIIKGRVKSLLADQKHAREVVQAALGMAKEKRQFSYNGALVLAEVAGRLPDLKASEIFFRICADQAAKLQSTQKVLQSYLGLIDLLYDNKKYDDCIKVCRELIELKTDDGKPRIVLYVVPAKFGEDGFSEDDHFDAVRGLRTIAQRLMIQALARKGNYDQALKMADNLAKKNRHWLDYALKGNILREAGRYADAVQVFEDVLEKVRTDRSLGNEDREEYLDRYRYTLSSIFVDLKQIDKASEQLQTLIAKHPDNPGYANDLGYIWADHDMKLPEAEKLIRKALELDKKRRMARPNFNPAKDRDNGAYLDSLGWVLFKQKKFKEAKKVLLKAVEDKDSQHIEIYDHLGDVHMALGEKEAALAAWRKGLKISSDSRRDQERRTIVEKKIAQAK